TSPAARAELAATLITPDSALPQRSDAPNPASAPTVATPQPSPSACQSAIATAGDRRGQLAPASKCAATTQPIATAPSVTTAPAAGDTAARRGPPVRRVPPPPPGPPALPPVPPRRKASRAARSASASAPETLLANLVSAAWRSPVWSSAVSISSATYASLLS